MSTRWQIVGIDPWLIMNGDIVVGSIKYTLNLSWQVEILWSGPSGDIKGDFNDYEKALAFIEGVEKTLIALGISDPRLAKHVHGG